MITLNIHKRDVKENVDALRTTGMIPAVYYGKKEKSTPIKVSFSDFIKVWRKAGESSVVTLQDGSAELDALIHDVDVDPVKGTARHADFYVFEKGQKIQVNVPIEFVGNAPAVKELGGNLVKVLREIRIEATPKDLPHTISVDISTLATFSSVVTAKDIKMPAGVTLVTGADEVVVSVYEPKEEVVEEVTAVDMSAIEVAKKGKEAKEGKEGAEGDAPATAEAKPAAKK